MKAQYVLPTDRGPDTPAEHKHWDECRQKRAPKPWLPPWKPGDVIEHPECWRLVRFGICKPFDEECRQRAGMTDEQIAEAIEMQKAVRAGQLTGDPTVDAPDEGDDDE